MTDEERSSCHSSPRSIRKHLRRAGLPGVRLATVLSSLALWSTGALNARPAAADQLANAQAEAAQLEQQIQSTDQQIDALDQQSDAAEINKAAVDMWVAATQQKIVQVKQKLNMDRARLHRAGVHPSVTESSNPAQELLFATNQRTFDAVDTYSDVAGGGLTVAIETLQASEGQLKIEQARLRAANRQATRTVNQANGADQKAQNEEALQQQALSDVNTQIAQLVEQQQQESQAVSAAAQTNSQQEQQAAAPTMTQPIESTQTTEPAVRHRQRPRVRPPRHRL